MMISRTLKLFVLVVAVAFTTLGCGGSIRQTRGASFELNAQEDSLATQYEQGDPRQAGLPARCDYWRRRTDETMRDHAMGILIWHANRFVVLHEWSNAKAGEVCTAAAEQQAKNVATQRNKEEADRVAAQREAKERTAADALAEWRTQCDDPTQDAKCLQAATRACQVTQEKEPCADAATLKEARARALAAEQQARARADAAARAAVEKLEDWAPSVVNVSWSVKSYHGETCVNRVDTEVPCTSAAAIKKTTSDVDVTSAFVTNRSRVPLYCEVTDMQAEFLKSSGLAAMVAAMGGAAPQSQIVKVPSQSTHTFTSRMDGGLRAMGGLIGTGGVAVVSVSCGNFVGEFAKARGFPGEGLPNDTVVLVQVLYDLSAKATVYKIHVGK